ncbi:hypothetical protein EWB00_010554 [Schistosoma japonicum]|uniref:Uncharacterized protein n=1 Tax=Schistosoma japonicum TaxID=6182 RepID=A0A4Z2DNX3_SCHJA|nr:hypothetical protein KSF78_0006291 [Schistosoma japonicum]TNN18211.1 hypothetical protein EWB00_010554 [Schistosoma japonicum]
MIPRFVTQVLMRMITDIQLICDDTDKSCYIQPVLRTGDSDLVIHVYFQQYCIIRIIKFNDSYATKVRC